MLHSSVSFTYQGWPARTALIKRSSRIEVKYKSKLRANSKQACTDYLAELGFGLSDLIEAQAMLW